MFYLSQAAEANWIQFATTFSCAYFFLKKSLILDFRLPYPGQKKFTTESCREGVYKGKEWKSALILEGQVSLTPATYFPSETYGEEYLAKGRVPIFLYLIVQLVSSQHIFST